MTDAEKIWREKSDQDLLEAAAELEEFTEEGQAIIRAELARRGFEDPMTQSGSEGDAAADDAEPELECLRCRATLRYLEPAAEDGRAWHWSGRAPVFNPGGGLHAYACPRCGHVEWFIDLPEDDEEGEDEAGR